MSFTNFVETLIKDKEHLTIDDYLLQFSLMGGKEEDSAIVRSFLEKRMKEGLTVKQAVDEISLFANKSNLDKTNAPDQFFVPLEYFCVPQVNNIVSVAYGNLASKSGEFCDGNCSGRVNSSEISSSSCKREETTKTEEKTSLSESRSESTRGQSESTSGNFSFSAQTLDNLKKLRENSVNEAKKELSKNLTLLEQRINWAAEQESRGLNFSVTFTNSPVTFKYAIEPFLEVLENYSIKVVQKVIPKQGYISYVLSL